MRVSPYTLRFLDSKLESRFLSYSIEINYKAQMIFFVIYELLCALFILMDVLNNNFLLKLKKFYRLCFLLQRLK